MPEVDLHVAPNITDNCFVIDVNLSQILSTSENASDGEISIDSLQQKFVNRLIKETMTAIVSQSTEISPNDQQPYSFP